MYSDFIKWLDNNKLECIYRKYLGVNCPGCGAQRALIELLKGNIIESFVLYPALIPVIIFVLYLIVSFFVSFKQNVRIIKFFGILILLLIAGNYLIYVFNNLI